MKKQSGKAFNPVRPLTDIELHTIKAGWDEWGNQGETGSLGGDLFENNAGTAVVGAGDAGTSPEEDTWSWATLDVPPDLNTQSADEGEDEGAAAAQAQADADAAAAAQGQADAGAAAAAQYQADADAAAAAQSQADAAAAAAQAQADADAAADDAAQAQADADAAQAQADADAAAAAAAQAQADEDAAAAAQAAADDAARAAASAYDAQVAADAAAQAALLAGDDDGDDDDSDDDDGYGGSIFNDYSLLSGSTAASNQSSANGFLAGSSSNSFQVPLTASDVTNLFGSGSGSLISSPVDLGSGPGGDPATSAIAPNSAGGLTSTNSNGLWVPNGLNDLLHGQAVLPGLPTAVSGGTVVVNQSVVTGLQMSTSDGGTVSASGVRMTITYNNNSGQNYNWSQVVTSDTLPHPTGTPPYSDGFGVLGTYYPSSQLQNANPPGAAVFTDRPVDTGPGSVSFTTQPLNLANPSQGSPFTISWGFTYTNSNGQPVIRPAPITVIRPPGGG